MKLALFFSVLRPHQWLKNLMLLFPPFLGGTLHRIDSLTAFALPLISFSLVASSIYVVNDIFDKQQDVNHPQKRQRPIASGQLSTRTAAFYAVLMFVVALPAAWQVSSSFLCVVLLYVLISVSYSLKLKSVPIVEMFCVISGFLLRLWAGGIAYRVSLSDWLVLSVFLLALFLVAGKRLGETNHAGGIAPTLIRPVLARYPARFFELCMAMSGAAVLVTYTLYLIRHHGNLLLVPLCCFGLLSYIARVLAGRGGDPTRALLRDPYLFVVGVAWVVLVAWDIYIR